MPRCLQYYEARWIRWQSGEIKSFSDQQWNIYPVRSLETVCRHKATCLPHRNARIAPSNLRRMPRWSVISRHKPGHRRLRRTSAKITVLVGHNDSTCLSGASRRDGFQAAYQLRLVTRTNADARRCLERDRGKIVHFLPALA